MSKRKGVSAEEKKTRMLQLFYEKKEFFQLKELERLAPKEKGIISNSVKDVVNSLVDEGLIDSEKVGQSIYFWAFPSKSIKAKKRKLSDLENEFEHSTKKLKLIAQNIEEVKSNQDNIEKIKQIENEMIPLKEKIDNLENQLKSYKDNDPETLENIKKETNLVKIACNRWTDNIFNIKTWCRNNFFTEDKVLNKQFGISDDLDYVE